MYDVSKLAHSVIKVYHDDMQMYPTTFLLQKILYYCQIFYLKRYEEKLFNEKILCSENGPCILEVYDLFESFTVDPIVISDDLLNQRGISGNDKQKIFELIEDVLDYLKSIDEQLLLDPAALSKYIQTKETAWKMQTNHDNGKKERQEIIEDYLLEEAKNISYD